MGSGSFIIKALHAAAMDCHISDSKTASLKLLSEWAKAVRTRFFVANAKNLGDVDLTETERQGRIIEKMSEITMQNLENNKNISARLDRIESQLTRLEGIEMMLYQLTVNDDSSPRVTNKKRSRTESPSLSPSNSSNAIAELSEDAPTPPSVDDTLMEATAVAKHIDFKDCGGWTCGKLVSSCILSLEDAESTSRTSLWLGNDVGSSLRGKCRRLYRALRNRAPEDKKKYFQASRFPATNTALTSWAGEVKAFLPGLVDAFINEMLQRMHPEDWEEKKKGRNSNVTAVEKLMQHYEADQKKQEINPWEGEVLGVIRTSS